MSGKNTETPVAKDNLEELKAENEQLLAKVSELEAENEKLKAALSIDSTKKVEKKNPLDDLNFTHEGKNYGFNLPFSRIEITAGNFIPLTAQEVTENKDIQKVLVKLYEEGSIKFIKEIKK